MASGAKGPDLARLLRACGRGDQAAFGRFYDATSSRAFGLAVRVVRDPVQAEEVTHEAFLEVWRNSGRFDPTKVSALGLLLTIVHRTAVGWVRSGKAATRRHATNGEHFEPVDHDAASMAAPASLDVRRVRETLRSLTDVQRETLELAYLGGYTHTEVAGALGLSAEAAKIALRDGLIRVRDSMALG
jgi:RNA polymerase sigma-70 factor (ECF subfamily)